MEGAATLQNAEIALVPFYIFQFVLELARDVANAPQRAGLPVLVQEVGLFGREVAFDPTNTPSVRRTLYKSIGPSAHIRTVEVPVRRRTIRFIFRFRGDLGLVFRHDGLDVVFKHVAFFFSLFILRIGVGGPFPSTGEEPVS